MTKIINQNCDQWSFILSLFHSKPPRDIVALAEAVVTCEKAGLEVTLPTDTKRAT